MRPRTVLYGRSPAALGTGVVESLSSYVVRLCHARRVSLADVFDRLVRPLMPEDVVPSRGSLSYYLSHDSADLDGLRPRVALYVSAFEGLTNCPRLRFHTFLPWRGLLASYSAGVVLRAGKRWCPRCFADWRDRRIELWEPLLWRVPPVRWCPEHKVPLAETCLVCGRPQRVLSQVAPIGHCERCGADLASGQWSGSDTLAVAEMEGDSPWGYWTALAVSQMLKAQPDFAERASPVGFAALIESARARFPRRSLVAMSRYLGFPRTTLEAARRLRRAPRLGTFLAVCMRLGANPLEVAFAPYGAVIGIGWDSAGLSSQPWPKLNPAFGSHACGRDSPERWSRISAALDAALAQHRVCSPTQFAKSQGVGHVSLRRRFPDRYRQLSGRFHTQRDADRRGAKEQRYQAVRDAVDTLEKAGKYPSRSLTFRTARVYGQDRYDPVLRDVWRAALRELGIFTDPQH